MHTIRLRGPWRFEVVERLAGDASLPDTGKQSMPADWAGALGADFRGTVRYRRTFHLPTGLEDDQQVWLVVEGAHSTAAVTLNETPLPAGGLAPEPHEPWRHEICELLLPTNELIIDVTHPVESSGAGGLTGLVQLEIQTVKTRPAD